MIYIANISYKYVGLGKIQFMGKEQTHSYIQEQLSLFANSTNSDELVKAIVSTTSILQGIEIDERQKQGVDLLIAKLQQDMIAAAIKKVQGKFDEGEKTQLQISVGFIIPGILSMGIFE